MKLQRTPYKGARDFYPEDKRKQTYMFDVIRKTVRLFGYEEYDAPILESLDLYRAKSGEEIVNEQTYSFTDRGGREVAIRPEMTPTVSRMVAAKRQELAYPLRWFSIPNLWRYERPQRGRLREHWQLNVDIFGVAGSDAELELIMIADAIFKAFGANSDMYEIRLNHRALMDQIFKEYLGLNSEQAYKMAKLIDRKAKLDHADFISQADEIFSVEQKEARATEGLIGLLSCKNPSDLPSALSKTAHIKEIQTILCSLEQHGIKNAVFDISLMRGFDYYNGIVFEVFDKHPDNNRSMMGGGRYDGLVGLFGVDPVPTAGFGLGDATMANFLELHCLMPNLPTETDVYIVVVGDNLEGATKTASDLRALGVNVAIDFSGKKLRDQIKTAMRKGINYVLVVGSRELETKAFTLRNLSISEEQVLALDKIASLVINDRDGLSNE